MFKTRAHDHDTIKEISEWKKDDIFNYSKTSKIRLKGHGLYIMPPAYNNMDAPHEIVGRRYNKSSMTLKSYFRGFTVPVFTVLINWHVIYKNFQLCFYHII